MGKTWVSARLSKEAMDVMQSVVSRTNCVGKAEAIEFIISEYQRLSKNSRRKFFHLNADKVKPLEAFQTA